MNALMYLFLHDAKNKLLELKRKPGKLILYILGLALLVGVVLLSVLQTPNEGAPTDIAWLKAIAIGFFLLTVITSILQGLKKGTTMFCMEDVNNLFVSPVSPREILLFGVVKMMKTAVLSSIFIFFNSMTLRDMFGVNFSGVLIIFAAFILVTAVSQLMTLVIYSFTNSRPKRQKTVKIVILILFAPMIISLFWNIWAAGFDAPAGILEFMRSTMSSLIPIAGWAAAGSTAFIAGETLAGALFFGLLVLIGAILVAAIYIGKPDYYEDVLVATETMFEKMRDYAEGNYAAITLADKNVKIKGTGIGGHGASALFHRHIREAFRANKFGLWGVSTLVLTALAAANAFIMIQMGGEGADSSGYMLTIIILMMIVQIFLVGMGKGQNDTYAHYIYLIPENPFKKIIWSNLEVIFKIAVQNALVFIAAGLVLGADASSIALAIITCTLLSFLTLGVSFLSMRFTGAHMSLGILSLLYIITLVVVMIPGVAGAILVGTLMEEGGLILGLLILSAWELIAGLACFAGSKRILHNCDIPTMGQMMKVK